MSVMGFFFLGTIIGAKWYYMPSEDVIKFPNEYEEKRERILERLGK